MHSFMPPDSLRPLALVCMLCAIAALVALRLMMQARARRTTMENAMLRRFSDASFEGLFVIEAGRVVDANTAMCLLLGCQPPDIIGRPIDAFFAPASRPELAALHGGARPGQRGIEADMQDAKGQSRRVKLQVRAPASPIRGAVTPAPRGPVTLEVRDAPRPAPAARIQDLAHTDPMTGLANRFLMHERLAAALTEARRANTAVAVLSIDIDHLHEVNNVFGRPAGDAVIAEMARRLRSLVRLTDTVARVGGDEFVIIAPLPKGPAGARPLAERLLRRMTEGFKYRSHLLEITASAGIALYPAGAATGEELLRQADSARARAKLEDRGGYRCFIPVAEPERPDHQLMSDDLHAAITDQAFSLHYQPMVNAETLSVVGYEALLRWRRPNGGLVPPGEFIPVAEACGAMAAIGQWVLETACAEAAAWPNRPGLSLNLAGVQLQDPDLAEQVADILARTGLPASRLELEVSERLLAADDQQALATLRDLQAQGIRIALDEFGSSTASLSVLRSFPFDRVKIHRSFIVDLGINPDAGAMVSRMIAMGREAAISVTATGIETEQQMAILRALRCNHLQGFVLGRPTPARDIAHAAPADFEIA